MRRVLCTIAVLTWLTFGTAFQVFAAEPMVSHYVSQAAAQQAGVYWTTERMLNAKPYPYNAIPGEAPPPGSISEDEISGAPGAEKGGLPGQTSVLMSDDDFDALAYTGAFGADDVASAADGYDYPPPHTTFFVLNSLYGTYPYKAIGKVFFSLSGSNYVCSGSAVGNKAVLTAGHCVSDGGKKVWATNWTFVPAYKNGAKPYGTWPAFWMTTFTAWLNSGQWGRDVGFAAVTNQNGKTLAKTVGYLGFAWNYSRKQHWNVFGYPSASPWDGQWMVETQASLASIYTAPNPDTTGVGTSQRPGFSGGPWILKFVPGSTGANNYANGVNSMYFIDNPDQIFSPYFDTNVKNMKDDAVAKN